jgi:hypothetical protein
MTTLANPEGGLRLRLQPALRATGYFFGPNTMIHVLRSPFSPVVDLIDEALLFRHESHLF